MTVTLAIPAHNDADDLARLLIRARQLDCFAQIVVVDDGSDVALDAQTLITRAGLSAERLTLLRNDPARGPGAARNRALAAATGSHVMFMDADDLPTRELPFLLDDLAPRDFDFCLFQHHDTRSEQELRWGQMPWDQRLWTAAGVDLGALSKVTDATGPLLAQTANYPWNKLYRTEFLRTHGIGCTEILVHEDVELHWRSFLKARSILASDRVAVIHVVRPDGERLTNRAGPERLDAFGPLSALAKEVAQTPYAPAFARFALGLIVWIADNLDPAHLPALAKHARIFLDTTLSAQTRAALTENDPALLDRLNTLISPN